MRELKRIMTTAEVARALSTPEHVWTARMVRNRLVGAPGSKTRAVTPFFQHGRTWYVAIADLYASAPAFGRAVEE